MATLAQKLARRQGDNLRFESCVALSVTAVANTDFTFTLPAGARDVSFTTTTITAFGAVTDAQLSIGKTVGGAEYVAAVSIKAAGKVTHTLVGTAIGELDTVTGQPGTQTTFNARIAQSGGNSATGAATLNVSYSLPV